MRIKCFVFRPRKKGIFVLEKGAKWSLPVVARNVLTLYGVYKRQMKIVPLSYTQVYKLEQYGTKKSEQQFYSEKPPAHIAGNYEELPLFLGF
jgi:hypothetical protein